MVFLLGLYKKRLAGKKCNSKEKFFQTILKEWNSIPDEKLHSYYTSFWARCKICKEINGENNFLLLKCTNLISFNS